MKVLNLLVLTFSLFSTSVFSEAGAFEDVSEFLSPQPETLAEILQEETWAYKFELVKSDGSYVTLSEQNKDVMLKPASTMKIFVGFWAYKLQIRTNTYIYQMLRQSVNAMADETAERMGGVLAMEEYYRDLGLTLDSTNFIAADGSGLSYDNRATCEVEIELLKIIRKDDGYQTFKKLMAQPGKDGTLETRLLGYKGLVFAKTGTLNKTAALTGFLETKKGTVLFCVMADYLRTSLKVARDKIDKMVGKHYSLALKQN